LERLRQNYCAVAGKKHVAISEELLAQVDTALRRAAEARNLV
jgi:hypothetical protein